MWDVFAGDGDEMGGGGVRGKHSTSEEAFTHRVVAVQAASCRSILCAMDRLEAYLSQN